MDGTKMHISKGNNIVAHCLRTLNKNIQTQVCTNITASNPSAKEHKQAEIISPADKLPKPKIVAPNSNDVKKIPKDKLLQQSVP